MPKVKKDLANVLDSSATEIQGILHEAKCIFDAERLSKHVNFLVKQQGSEAVFLFLSYCMGVRCKLLLQTIISSYRQDFAKVNKIT